jgi:hypothetical protein
VLLAFKTGAAIFCFHISMKYIHIGSRLTSSADMGPPRIHRGAPSGPPRPNAGHSR